MEVQGWETKVRRHGAMLTREERRKERDGKPNYITLLFLLTTDRQARFIAHVLSRAHGILFIFLFCSDD